jgi:hypothetical protein
MATGNSIIAKIRRVLHDVTSAVQIGEFWSNTEIITAVNAAQMSLFDILLKKKSKNALQKLVSTQTTSIAGQTSGIFNANLPTDYAHYLSVSVNGETGRVYLGGRGVQYLDVRHNGVAILGSKWYLLCRTLTPASGNVVLYYYKYPTAIAANGTTLADFEEPIYDAIINWASAICGQKELQRGRDISKLKTTASVVAGESDNGVYYTPITPYENEWNGDNANAKNAAR